MKIEAQKGLRIAYICPRNTVRGIHLFNFDLTHLSIHPTTIHKEQSVLEKAISPPQKNLALLTHEKNTEGPQLKL